jgi:N-acetylglutamate synthase-like GNAT family acetyltransferase
VSNTVSIHLATSRDLKYVDALARKFSNQIGFIPTLALEKHIDRRNVLLAKENGHHAGYILTGAPLTGARNVIPIFQAAIQLDAQRRGAGLFLVETVIAGAQDDGLDLVQLWCREDLEANAFWHAAGFRPIARRTANTARGFPAVLWRKPARRITAHILHSLPAPSRNHGPGGRFVSSDANGPQFSTAHLSRADRLQLLARLPAA